jgi:hypothetical protein
MVALLPAVGVPMSTLIAVVSVEVPANAYVGDPNTLSRWSVKDPVAQVRVAAVKLAPIDSVLDVCPVSAGVVNVKYGTAPDVRAAGVNVCTAVNVCATSIPANVRAVSGAVIVLLAVSVVGVIVTAYDDDPPARPCSLTASCVAAAWAVITPLTVTFPLNVRPLLVEPISMKSDPFHATVPVAPAAIVTPVVDVPLITTAPFDWLMT